MRTTHRKLTTSASALTAALLIVACSGGGDDGGAADTTSEPTTTSQPGDTEEPTDEPADASSPTTAPPETTTTPPASTTTTTTEPPVIELPVGAIWQSTSVHEILGFSSSSRLQQVGDEVWLTGGVANAPAVWRSDDGTTWTETIVAPPIPSVRVNLYDVLPRGDGFIAWGLEFRSCAFSGDLGNGLTDVQSCDVRRIAIYLSDDGTSWRRIEPSAMQVGGNSSSRIDDITAVDDGYVAIGTFSDRDWHSRMWFSPDGESWDLITEFRGVDGPMSGDEVHWDGNNLTVMTVEHPCSQFSINFNTPGWILGSSWASHIRMFSGPDVNSLTPVAPETSPLLEPPLTVDCSVDRGFDVSMAPYPRATGQVIDGTLTLLDTSLSLPEDDGDSDGSNDVGSFPYRLLTFDGSEWTETFTDGVDRTERTDFVVIDDAPAFVQWSQGSAGAVDLAIVRQADDGEWTRVAAQRPTRGRNVESATGFGDSVLISSIARRNPFVQPAEGTAERSAVVAVSRVVRDDEIGECIPAAASTCELGRFELVDGYPDLAGSDFSGAELSFADLSDGDYTDATFAGSVLIGAETSFGSLLLGADLSGTDLSGANLQDVGDANLTGADLSKAEIWFSSLPDLTDAILVDASLRFTNRPDGGFDDVVLSLPGRDLTGTRINGPVADDDPLLVIGDLSGSTLDGTRFRRVDMSAAILDPDVDLAAFTLSDDSICPDGEPPIGDFSGTCDRTAPPEE